MHRYICSYMLAMAIVFGAGITEVRAQTRDSDADHEQADHDHDGLHFSHPLIAESVSPDTKVRLDHQFLDLPDGDQINVGVFEAEYAFFRSFSIETGLPYSYTDGDFGNLEVALKFANFALEDAGILLGYGVEFGFPTAGGLIEAESEIAPFLNIGLKRGDLEIVAWGILGVPFSQEEGEEIETEIEVNLAALYHISERFDALLEMDGAGGISGDAVGEDVVNLSPGIRFRLGPDGPLVIGSSIGFPLTNQEEFSTRWTTSLFWHF